MKTRFMELFHDVVFDSEGKIRKKRLGIFVISLSLLILSFVYDPLIFVQEGGMDSVPYNKMWIWFTKLLLFVLLLVFWNYVFSKRLRDHKFTIICLIPVLILFLLIYPGVWRWDDLTILDYVMHGEIFYWQHWLSGVYYYLCLCLIPIPAGIVIVQSVIICFISGYLIERVHGVVGKWALLLYILFFTPFVLDTIYYPMRASVSGFLELYLVIEMLVITIKHESMSKRKILSLVLVSAVLSAWRPENILWIIILALFLLFIAKYSFKTTCKYVAVGLVIVLLSMTVQSNGLSETDWRWASSGENTLHESEMYTLTGFIEPFGELVKIASERGEFSEELAKVDESISVEMICERGGTSAFWGGAVKSLTKEQLRELEWIYVKMIFAYLPEFLEERTEKFMETNGYGEAETMVKASAHIYDDPETLPEDMKGAYSSFSQGYIFNKPINVELRKTIISTLEMKNVTDYQYSTTGLVKYVYNCLPSLICVLLMGLIAIFIRRWEFIIVITGMILKDAIVFFMAMTPYYMYYFSTQLICSTLIVFSISLYLHKKSDNNYGCSLCTKND